ncbi:MAG: hypothetical protein NVSMB6_24040 [Burkholderiaceae bacterium]
MHMTPTPLISAYRRIQAAGFEVKVSQQRNAYRLKLMNGEEVLAHVDCSRTGNLSVAGALHKAAMNTFGPTSGFYRAMQQLADIAESHSSVGV